MKHGYLSQYFSGVATKYLSAVEADETRSNQHEYNATREMLNFMGESSEKRKFSARFMYMTDSDPEPVIENAYLTLYNSRLKQPHRSAEYRFYFPTTSVSLNAAENDLLVIAKQRNGDLLVIIAEAGTTTAQQIAWLFGCSDASHPGFSVKAELESEKDKIGFASQIILEQIGISAIEEDESFLDVMLNKFNGGFPSTKIFSEYARNTINNSDLSSDPDATFMAWIEREEILFRTLEKHFIAERLQKGFAETEDFISYSLSIQNRRKSRAGGALENHLEQMFKDEGMSFSRNAITENKHKPDFIFPSIAQYHANNYPEALLTMLASKSTCKDRWRQILNEALRIKNKHLFTLEPSISETQTHEMQLENVQLVVPQSLKETYSKSQQKWLFNLNEFITHVKQKK